VKLIVHELKASALVQQMTPTKNVSVVAVRPHLYRHNFATGSLKIQITDDSDAVIAESNELAIDDLGTMDYAHGYYRFDINAVLRSGVTYKFKLVGGDGYSFDESAYVGWCNGYDLGKYPMDVTPTDSLNYPLALEIWERKSV
jgi:hypothetical protein